LDPNASNVWNQLLTCDEALADYASMVKHCAMAIELYPYEVNYYYYGAFASYRIQDYSQTIKFALEGIDLTIPGDEIRINMYSLAGDAAHYAKNYALCDSIYMQAIDEYPESALALNNYAYFLSLRNEKLDLAASYSKKSLELEPKNPSYLDTYAWIMYKQKNYSEAQKYILQTLEFTPESAEVLEHAGDIYYKLGKTDEAVNFWMKAKNNGSKNEFIDKKIKDKKLYE
jgi:tetratricopeptide (TPR) repeat protein